MWDHLGPLKCPAGGRLTSNTNTFMGIHTLSTVTFSSLGFLLVERTVRSIQTTLTRWFEFRSRNSWLTACFLLPYTPFAPYFSHFLHPDYSATVSSFSATHCVGVGVGVRACVCMFVEQPWKQLTVNISLGGVRRWKNSSELEIFPH